MEESKNILYSQTVKAGKRIYYIDVKADSNADRYITITESKRLQASKEGEQPRIEKHRIFLYREEFGKVLDALRGAIAFAEGEADGEWQSGISIDIDF